MWPNPQETADLITVTEEILNGKLRFLCSVIFSFSSRRSQIYRLICYKYWNSNPMKPFQDINSVVK